MKREDIQKSLEKATGATLVSITDIANWSGRSRDFVRAHIIKDVDYITNGKTKLYYSGDIAEAICKRKRR